MRVLLGLGWSPGRPVDRASAPYWRNAKSEVDAILQPPAELRLPDGMKQRLEVGLEIGRGHMGLLPAISGVAPQQIGAGRLAAILYGYRLGSVK